MPDFTCRSNDVEIMDDLQCSGAIVDQTLREIETINLLLGGNHVTINGITKLVKGHEKENLRIADLGCGGGDMLRLIRKWAHKKNLAAGLIGIDANPNIIAFARKHTPYTFGIQYTAADIFSDDFKQESFDIVVATLFFHHFTNEQLVYFFRELKSQTRIGFVINDIHRHWFAYYSIKLLTRVLSKSAMVKFDAPLSVLRAFKKPELIEILERAGIKRFHIRWMWAFRWQVVAYTNL